ncbi:MAG: arsenosugar biosynthesis radical SAM protein ArsS [Planctomycetota bacterium]|nr:arsenosugar biosynthesis radical SAM protein ArsS [Planctomycetota bacterium]
MNPGAKAGLQAASKRLKVVPTLKRRGAELSDPKVQMETLRRIPIDDLHDGDFDRHLAGAGLHPLTATGIDVFQINVGRQCNQTCQHCHVDAGPDRTESMTRETAEACMRVLARTDIPTVDITGGAPEMCPQFRTLVEESRRLGRHVMDRCNLTILLAKGFTDLPEFFAEHRVEVICSLPHYRQLNTDRQRGDGVFERSIEALHRLNEVGYGKGDGLRLVLVTNPVGAFLPSGQASLEAEWKRELERLHGIVFDALYTITNLPISRFLEWLQKTGNLEAYMQRLVSAFNPAAAAGVMCRNTLSVGWDGRLFDCDFNQMLDIEVGFDAPRHIDEFDAELLGRRRIVTGRHCFGCTAGAGSSCGGTTA